MHGLSDRFSGASLSCAAMSDRMAKPTTVGSKMSTTKLMCLDSDPQLVLL